MGQRYISATRTMCTVRLRRTVLYDWTRCLQVVINSSLKERLGTMVERSACQMLPKDTELVHDIGMELLGLAVIRILLPVPPPPPRKPSHSTFATD